jgi:phosphocarrier protein HPr
MGDAQTYEVKATICNELGMHARAATKFVQLASSFPCDVFVEKDGQVVNGKSIMGVLMLVASVGSVVTIQCRGARAEEAGKALVKLIEDRFGEER